MKQLSQPRARLPLQMARMHRPRRRIILQRVQNALGVPERRLGVHQMLRPRRKSNPLSIRSLTRHLFCQRPQLGVDGAIGTEVPFVKGGPGALEGADDAFFECGAVLLHNYDGFLEEVFFEDLAGELAGYGGVGNVAGNGDRWPRCAVGMKGMVETGGNGTIGRGNDEGEKVSYERGR